MAKSGRRPKWGQHFLHDERALARLASALPLEPGRLVVEIGPGEGALTRRLTQTGARVTAVEIDPALADRIRTQFAGVSDFQVLNGDFLEIDLEELLGPVGGSKAVVAGNLPYYATSPIVRKILPLGSRIEAAVFLVQREVAARIAARKGSRDYGYLSALCRLYSDPEILFTLKPGAFRPPPRVESAAVKLRLKPDFAIPAGLDRFLGMAFRQPRKTLLNNLGPEYGREVVARCPEAGLRAQQLDVEELVELWRGLAGRAA